MASSDHETEHDDQPSTKSADRVDGFVPPFLKKHLLTPQLALGVIALAGIASIPFWHLHGPDIGEMASAVHFGSLAADATASDDKKEAPDLASATPFAKRRASGAPHIVAPHLFAPAASPAPQIRHVTVARAVSGTQASPPTTALMSVTRQPEPPSDTRGAFGEPSDGNVSHELKLAADSAAGAQTGSNVTPSERRANYASDRNVGGLGYVAQVSAFELSEGGVIHCRWVTHVDSEQSGHVTGQIIEPVYSSIDPRVEVLPTGAQLQGWYRTAASGQTRLFVAWNRINFPDGRKFEMGEEAGTDEVGGTGIGGTVNSHVGKLFGQAVLYTALNAAGQSLSHALFSSSSITQTFSDQQPQIKPTIYTDPPARFDINVVRDLPLDRYEVRG